jgi:hypothetical protein
MDTQLVKQLMYAGTVPFLLGALILTLNINVPLSEHYFEIILMSYTLVIVSFLSGIHWAIGLLCPEKSPTNLFILSNAVTLFVWFVFTVSCAGLFFLVSAVVFIVLMWVDQKLFRASVISREYFRLRKQATGVVVICLLLSFAF